MDPFRSFPSTVPASRSGRDAEKRRGATRFHDRAHRAVTGKGFEPARRIEHERQQVQVAGRDEVDPRPRQHPVDGLCVCVYKNIMDEWGVCYDSLSQGS